ALSTERNDPQPDWAFGHDDHVIARLNDLPRKNHGQRAYGRIPRILEATLGKWSLFRIVEFLRVPHADRSRQIETSLRKRHSPVLRSHDEGRSVLAFHPHELRDVVKLEIGVYDSRYPRANGSRHDLGLLRTHDEGFDTGRPFQHRQKFCRPHTLQIGMT